tara:strand:- start:263 stop:781 length:519 start_codon:yes stop_codon:yes gene_type:complete
MSNDLVVVSSNTLSSDTGSVTLTGMSSSFTHYLATFNEVTPTVANADLQFRFTVGGSAVSSNDYDEAIAFLRSDSTNDNDSQTNRNNMFLTGSIENDDEGTCNGLIYIFNSQNSANTYATLEDVYIAEDGTMLGQQGGFLLTSSSVVDGVQYFFDSGNIRDGARFVLYGFNK